MNPRVVIDTNILVGACLGQGTTRAVIASCLCKQYQPLVGAALLAEYEDFFGRAELVARSRLDAAEREELLDIFLASCEWTRIYFGWRPNLPDEGDNHLVELAVAGGAHYLVTRNLRDLGRMELRFPQLRVLAPEDFLKELSP